MKVLATLALTSLMVAGWAFAAQQKEVYKLTSTLKAGAEVPKPAGVRVGAAGTFTGWATSIPGNARVRLTWRLTFANLTGAAAAAHIHIGKRGKAGNVMVALCGPCRNGQKGSATVTKAQLATIRAGTTYVNVHTARNAAGEVRGQIVAKKGPTTAGSPPPGPPPPPPPPPGYDPPYP